MADTKISSLTGIASGLLAVGDKVAVADASDLTASYSATMANLKDFIAPNGYIWDLTMSNAADAANDITVAAGEAKDEGNAAVMVLAAAITKQIDAVWAAGTDAGGLNTGTVANDTWYEVHLIKRVDTGVVDVMFTTTANRATLPTNYTKQRRIGWIRRGTAANLAFTQVDDRFTLTTPIQDVSVACTITATAVTLTVPPNTIARFRGSGTCSTTTNAGGAIVFKEMVEDGTEPDDTTGVASLGQMDALAGAGGHFELRVSSSSQIEHDSELTAGSATLDISTYGWIDHRRKMSAI